MEARNIIDEELIKLIKIKQDELRKILTDKTLHGEKGELIEVNYIAWIPAELAKAKKKINKNQLFAMDKLVYSEFKELLARTIFSINLIEEKIRSSLKDAKVVAFFAALQEIKKKLLLSYEKQEPNAADLYYLLKEDNKAWQNLIKALQNILDAEQKGGLTESELELCNELKVVLEALYWHVCIDYRIKEINDLCESKDSGMQKQIAHPLNEAFKEDQKITVGMKKALEKIAAMETEESLPIILTILMQIRRKLIMENCSSQSINAVDFSLKIVNDFNMKQYNDIPTQLKFLGDNKNKIRPDLQNLVNQIKGVKDEEVFPELQQLAKILDGVCLHSYNMGFFEIKKRNTAMYVYTKDAEGGALDTLQIASYYHRAARAISEIIAEAKNNILPKTRSNRAIESSSTEVSVSEKDKLAKGEIIEHLPQTDQKHSGGIAKSDQKSLSDDQKELKELTDELINSPSPEDEKKIPLIIDAIKAIRSGKKLTTRESSNLLTEVIDEETFEKILFEAKGSEESKIDALYNVIKLYGLSEKQKNRLIYYKEACLTELEKYKNGKGFFGIIGTYIFPPYHAALVDKTIIDIKEESEPKRILFILFVLRFLLPTLGSAKLLPQVNNLLLRAYNSLTPEPQIKQQPVIMMQQYPGMFAQQNALREEGVDTKKEKKIKKAKK